MEVEETYEMAGEADTFKSALINIFLKLNGTEVIVDLIESQRTDQRLGEMELGLSPELKDILSGSQRTISSGRVTRVHFNHLRAMIVQEEYVDLVENIKADFKRVPRLSNRDTYPFIKVVNSRWRTLLPDYQRGDDPGIQHFKIISMETCIDIIARLNKIESGLTDADSDAGPTETAQF